MTEKNIENICRENRRVVASILIVFTILATMYVGTMKYRERMPTTLPKKEINRRPEKIAIRSERINANRNRTSARDKSNRNRTCARNNSNRNRTSNKSVLVEPFLHEP